MLDAFIIDKIKKDEERQEEQWQPLPLEAPEEQKEDKGDRHRKEEPKAVTIRF